MMGVVMMTMGGVQNGAMRVSEMNVCLVVFCFVWFSVVIQFDDGDDRDGCFGGGGGSNNAAAAGTMSVAM